MKKYLINTIIIDDYEGFKIEDLDGLKSFRIPKKLLKKIGKLNEKEDLGISNAGIYFLVNKENKTIYIGQTNNIYDRLMTHNRSNDKLKKESIIIALTTESNSLSKTFIDYLEYHYIQKYKDNNYWILENKDMREKKPNVGMYDKIKIEGFISKINKILSLNGVIFKKIHHEQKVSHSLNENLFYFNGAKLLYDNENVILLKDSIIYNWTEETISENSLKNFYPTEIIKKMVSILEYKNKLYEKGLIKCVDDKKCILLSNIKLKSANFCYSLISGNIDSNGFKKFKNSNNVSFEEFYKK